MRNFLLAALAAFAFYGSGLGGAVGQSSDDGEDRWVTVKNESSFTTVRIFIIPSGRTCCWSHDLLEDIVVPHRLESGPSKKPNRDPVNHQKINFDDGSRSCVFNIRVTAARPFRTTELPGWEWVFKEVNVCRVSEITLEGDDVPSNDGMERTITIKNESRLAAHNVYAIPYGKDCCWSRDLLGGDAIPKLSEYKVNFDDGKKTCVYDIRITSSKKAIDWYLDRVDVCNVPDDRKITLRTRGSDGTRRLVTLKNESRLDAISAFVIPVGESCCWSNDLLGDRFIPRGKSLLVEFDDESGNCIYYYRIARSDNGMEWFGAVDVCSKEPADIPTLPLP